MKFFNKEKFTKKRIISFFRESGKIIFILFACACLGAFLAVGIRAGSSKRFAEQYFSYYITNNYRQMYRHIDSKESEFVTLESFINKCEGEKVYGSVRGYSFSKGVKQGKKVTYVVSYYLGTDQKPHTYTITLNKQKYHKYLFFNKWKVDVNHMIAQDYTISVPVGTAVTLDGNDLTGYKKETSEDGASDIYVVNRILTGDHTVSVNLDATGEVTKTEYVSGDNQKIDITTSDFAIKPDVEQKLYEYSTYIVKTIYEYAMDNTKNSENIAMLYAQTEDAKNSAKETYEAIRSGIQKQNGEAIKVLNIKTLSPNIESFTYPDKVSVKVTYTYDFTAVTGTSTLSGLTKEYGGSGTDVATVELNLIDGAWKIVKVDMKCVDYSKQES